MWEEQIDPYKGEIITFTDREYREPNNCGQAILQHSVSSRSTYSLKFIIARAQQATVTQENHTSGKVVLKKREDKEFQKMQISKNIDSIIHHQNWDSRLLFMKNIKSWQSWCVTKNCLRDDKCSRNCNVWNLLVYFDNNAWEFTNRHNITKFQRPTNSNEMPHTFSKKNWVDELSRTKVVIQP